MDTASNLVLIGPMGAGKTSIGKRLAERFGLGFVDADREMEAQTGVSIATIFDCEGEAGFRERERSVLARLLETRDRLIATGGGAVLDPESRALMRRQAFVVYLHVDVEGQLRRLERCTHRPLLQRPDRESMLHELAAAREPLYAETADLRFDTRDLSPTEATSLLAKQLAERWKPGAAAA